MEATLTIVPPEWYNEVESLFGWLTSLIDSSFATSAMPTNTDMASLDAHLALGDDTARVKVYSFVVYHIMSECLPSTLELWQLELYSQYIRTLTCHAAALPESSNCVLFNWVSDVMVPPFLTALETRVTKNYRYV